MSTLKLTLAYDGTRYAGWQVQARDKGKMARGKGSDKPTIQGTLEGVLRQVLQEPVRVVGSGRTDAGVHAEAQVAHVSTRAALPPERLLHSLNQLLPPDIAVMRIEPAARGFHARFDASRKRYRYRIFAGRVVPPFIHSYVHHVRTPLNLALMRREAAACKGRHDFRAFARSGSTRGTTRRRVTSVRVVRRREEIHIEVEGGGFLHTMVRSLAGTLLDVGRGRLPPGTVRRMLATGDRRLTGTTAPAEGLTLLSVSY